MISGLPVIVTAAVAGLAGHRFLTWIKEAPLHPDPWGPAVTEALNQPDAVEVCHHCGEPTPATGWFCPQCGNAVGPYNNLIPYVRVFSEGEVLRNGVAVGSRVNLLTTVGYFLFTLGVYSFLAPVYWVVLLRHFQRRRQANTDIAAGKNPEG